MIVRTAASVRQLDLVASVKDLLTGRTGDTVHDGEPRQLRVGLIWPRAGRDRDCVGGVQVTVGSEVRVKRYPEQSRLADVEDVQRDHGGWKDCSVAVDQDRA